MKRNIATMLVTTVLLTAAGAATAEMDQPGGRYLTDEQVRYFERKEAAIQGGDPVLNGWFEAQRSRDSASSDGF